MRGSGSLTAGFRAGFCALAMALALAGCSQKETGPDPDTTGAAPASAAPVAAAMANPAATTSLATFDGRDTNHDGRITSAEYAGVATKVFATLDADHDGNLSIGEMKAARQASGFDPGESTEKFMEDADADHDNRLTLGEFIAATNVRFDQLDINHDGFITRAEWTVGHPVRRAMAPVR